MDTEEPLNRAAAARFNIPYLFPYQRLVISNILEGAGYFSGGTVGDESTCTAGNPDAFFDSIASEDCFQRQIAVLPTGAGKSLCFMLPGVLMEGITIILFPLLSLLADQKRRLDEQHIASELLRGGQRGAERRAAWRRLESGQSRFLLSNPETMTAPEALDRLEGLNVSHLVIDEAHTLPMWGKEFRPALLQIPALIESCRPKMISAFTATASDKVLAQLQSLLFPDEAAHVIRANPDRPNISYHVIESLCKLYDLRRLLAPDYPFCLPRPTIVFCSTRMQTQRCAMYLRRAFGSREIYFYHAGLEREEKQRVQEWFFDSTDGILCCTNAFGMGVDKKNIRTVIHFNLSRSIEAFLQESGRGGRDSEPAYSVVLYDIYDKAVGESLKAAGKQVSSKAPRFRRLLTAVTDPHKCVRDSLMEEMGSEPVFCNGCDVCTRSRPYEPTGHRAILNFFRVYPGRYTDREAATVLSGQRSSAEMEQGYQRMFGFAGLQDWRLEEIEAAIECLVKAGELKQPRRGFRRGCIRPRYKGFKTQRLL